jgi:hypothetical protein
MTTINMPEEKVRELPPAGSHTGLCYLIAEMGTQQTNFGHKRLLLIGWELPDEVRNDGRPHAISRRYTLSSDKKATLRQDIEGWLGRALTSSDFGRLNLADLLGTTCTLGIKHEANGDRTYANIVSVMKAGKTVPPQLSPSNDPVAFSLSEEPFNHAAYEALPSWLREQIAKSPEYQEVTKPPSTGSVTARLKEALVPSAAATATAADDLDDKIPF